MTPLRKQVILATMNTFDIKIIEGVERKVRSDAVLCSLPSDKKVRIILWLGQYSYRNTLVKIEACSSEGAWRQGHPANPNKRVRHRLD